MYEEQGLILFFPHNIPYSSQDHLENITKFKNIESHLKLLKDL